ncbi:hypothetical protein DFH06DRAFT_1479837 [Mycena polygramma]|nr:hypothetical protein DFH06DRAFT_1479837 [Mycena polygramma]
MEILSHSFPPSLFSGRLHRSQCFGLRRMFCTLSPTIIHRRGLACPKTDNSGVPLADTATTLGGNLFGCQYNAPSTTLACFYSDADGTLKIGTSGCPSRLGDSEAPTTKQSNTASTTKSTAPTPSQSAKSPSIPATSNPDTTSAIPTSEHIFSTGAISPTTPAPTSSSTGILSGLTTEASPRSQSLFVNSPSVVASSPTVSEANSQPRCIAMHRC